MALLGAGALGKIALDRGESLNAIWFVIAAVCCYLVAYRLYSAFLAARLLALDDRRATPSERNDDGRDFVPTSKWVLFGHHFAAIAGPGPLVGPTLAAQFGYLPGALWIIVGAVVGGAVQDFVVLFCSLRRNGKSLGEMAREEIGKVGGFIALVTVGVVVGNHLMLKRQRRLDREMSHAMAQRSREDGSGIDRPAWTPSRRTEFPTQDSKHPTASTR